MSNDSDSDRLPFKEYRVWSSPSPGAYAAFRLNPVEMVQHLDDNDALQAAMAMQTKTYLVCLDILILTLQEMTLPFPDRPWYRFEARPIGPHLPPANEEEGYTPEMCIPIYPNTSHPTGRAPIRPRIPFPYGNCYHWIDNTIHIRVRARPEGFDETNAVKISARTELLIGKLFMEDILRARKTAALQEPLLAVAPGPSIVRGRDHAAVAASMFHAPPVHSGRELADGDCASISSEWSRSRESAEVLNSNFDDFLGMDIFAGPDEDLALVPLVDLWPDLAATLKEEDIASPLELQKEIDMIQGIIRNACVRAYAALTAPATQSVSNTATTSPRSQSSSIRSRITHAARRWWESRLLVQTRRAFSRIKSVFRLRFVISA